MAKFIPCRLEDQRKLRIGVVSLTAVRVASGVALCNTGQLKAGRHFLVANRIIKTASSPRKLITVSASIKGRNETNLSPMVGGCSGKAGAGNAGGCGMAGGVICGGCQGGAGAGTGGHAGAAGDGICGYCIGFGGAAGVPAPAGGDPIPLASLIDRSLEPSSTMVCALFPGGSASSGFGEPVRLKAIVASDGGTGSDLDESIKRVNPPSPAGGRGGLEGRTGSTLYPGKVPPGRVGYVRGVVEGGGSGAAHDGEGPNSSVNVPRCFFDAGGSGAEGKWKAWVKLPGSVSGGLGALRSGTEACGKPGNPAPDGLGSPPMRGRGNSSLPAGVKTPSPEPNRRVNEPGDGVRSGRGCLSAGGGKLFSPRSAGLRVKAFTPSKADVKELAGRGSGGSGNGDRG